MSGPLFLTWLLRVLRGVWARGLPNHHFTLAFTRSFLLAWNGFFSRVLPQNDSDSCIGNEDYPEQLFDVSASDAARAASLRALGWPDGRLPDKKVLLEHMLTRAEYEYAEHLYDHAYESGEWCEGCQCICARVFVVPSEGESDSTDDDGGGADDVCGYDSPDGIDNYRDYLFDDSDEPGNGSDNGSDGGSPHRSATAAA